MKILSVVLFSIFFLQASAQEVPEPTARNIEQIIKPILKFFKIFGDRDGCAQGKFINPFVHKFIDQEINFEKICLGDKVSDTTFTISWYLKNKIKNTKRRHVTLAKYGHLKFAVVEKELILKIKGLTIKPTVKKNILKKLLVFKVAKLKIDEQVKNFEISAWDLFIPAKMGGDIKHFIKDSKMDYWKIFGLRFNIKN